MLISKPIMLAIAPTFRAEIPSSEILDNFFSGDSILYFKLTPFSEFSLHTLQ